MIAPGQALPRVHMMICCPRATLPRVNFIAPGQVQGHLITTKLSEFLYFLHKLLQRMNFKHVYLFLVLLELFIGKFIPNINNEYMQDCSCPRATFAFCSNGEKLLRQGGLPDVVQQVTRLSKLPRARKNSCEQLQASDRSPRQS